MKCIEADLELCLDKVPESNQSLDEKQISMLVL